MTELYTPNLHTEALKPNVTIFEKKKVFKGAIEVKLGHKDGALIWLDWHSYKGKRHQSSFSPCLHLPEKD